MAFAIVYMNLERPEYLGDDIVEIGDTRLVVESRH